MAVPLCAIDLTEGSAIMCVDLTDGSAIMCVDLTDSSVCNDLAGPGPPQQ